MGMLKRVLIYCMLGPALCYASALALNPRYVLVSLKSIGDILSSAYLILAPPFFLCALVDLSMKGMWRLLTVAIVVFAVTPISILAMASTSDTLTSALQFSLVAIIPAVICSWLSNAKQERAG